MVQIPTAMVQIPIQGWGHSSSFHTQLPTVLLLQSPTVKSQSDLSGRRLNNAQARSCVKKVVKSTSIHKTQKLYNTV